jgi:hypothetical protein
MRAVAQPVDLMRRLLVPLLAVTVAVNMLLVGVGVGVDGVRLTPESVQAAVTCASTQEYVHAWGQENVPYANGVKAQIQGVVDPVVCYVPPNPQDRFTSENISVCIASVCTGWVQVGWIWRYGWSQPQQFCEFAPSNGNTRQWLGAWMGVSTKTYRLDVQGSSWYCGLDQAQAWHKTTTYMGFSSGTHLVAQGETDSLWSQIGDVAIGIPPSTTLLDQMKYLYGSSWLTFDVAGVDIAGPSGSGSHYGVSEPAPGSLRNWTK